ncbi:hypothetical protein [Aliidiomarina quisquiliarum]|uniref:hypothetical protein n=1 Tax=Aliidiomarina quisquiliarum TaxID=2938947 RepID=UPI00208EF085|nr:hypothetical protein [Aliidiomarina quisquiliarum]MCO4319908.1 hypothetical protein [Aliidiomarina quisquiliarum]
MQTLNSTAVLQQASAPIQESKIKQHAKAMFWVLLSLVFVGAVYAQGDDAGFVDIDALDQLWTFFSGIVTGMLGKILALLALVASFWQGFEQNWRAAAGAGLMCLALAFGPAVINGLFSAGVPI